MRLDRIELAPPSPPPPPPAGPWLIRPRPNAAATFADACGALPGARILRDVALDEVALSFGGRTREVWARLAARGYRLNLTEWGGQKVLRIPFSGDRFGHAWALELAEVLFAVVGEMHVADTRLW